MEPPRTHRYEIEGSIGVGGVGEVFRARDTRLNRPVALKRLWPEPDAPAGQTYAHALREAIHLAALQHPHVVSVYDMDEDERGPYVVMELVEGDTLETAVERGPFNLEDFLLLAGQMLDALAAAHHVGLLHRDLKPANVMLKHGVAGEPFEVKLLDFGLSRFAVRPGRWALGTLVKGSTDDQHSVVGSIHFMAPEQFTRDRPPDVRTDLYSLGCLLYFALTAAYAVDGDTVGVVVENHLYGNVFPLAPRRPDVPSALCAWVMRLLAVQSEDRPDSAARALEELQALRDLAYDPARAISVPSSSAEQHLRRTARLHLPSPPARKEPPSPPLLPDHASPQRRSDGSGKVGGALGSVGALAAAGGALLGSLRSRPPVIRPAASSPAPRPEPAPAILAAANGPALRARLGLEVFVEGRLLPVEPNAEHTMFSLPFEPGADGTALALVFFVHMMPPGLTGADLPNYVGHRVRVRGQVSEYRGALQMVVRDRAQIEAAC